MKSQVQNYEPTKPSSYEKPEIPSTWQKTKKHGLTVCYPSGAVWPSWRQVDRYGEPLRARSIKSDTLLLVPTETVPVRTGMLDMSAVAVRGQDKKVSGSYKRERVCAFYKLFSDE